MVFVKYPNVRLKDELKHLVSVQDLIFHLLNLKEDILQHFLNIIIIASNSKLEFLPRRLPILSLTFVN